MSTTAALLRFHLATGARIALRASVPLAAVFVVAVGLSEEPELALRRLAARVAADPPDAALALGLLALAVGLAGWASPRVTLGLGGWIRHLPASSAAHRRAAGVAVGLVLAPLLTLVAGLMIAGWIQGAHVQVAKLAGLPLLGLGAAYCALPNRRRVLVAACALAAAIGGLAGSWVLVLAGVVALALADALAAGSIVHSRHDPGWRARGGPLLWTISRRAIGLKALLGALPSFVILGACALFLRNNELTREQAALGARLGGGVAVTVMLAGLADFLALRRPVWPWARTLPWTSARRVALDAAFLALATLPIFLLLAGLDAGAAVCVLGALPLLALRAASAMRREGKFATAASGAILVEGMLLSAWLAFLPWLAVLYALASLPALRLAARRERTLQVGRFRALHHSAAGDPLSWEGR